ncbi:MAG: PspC domain-containing protein [Clostridiales Family XIII bacterium]|jgi:phage shock protein C|nr:PspC domain-containing protein [Clostridiales Family XIII bacterium]
MAEKKRLFLSDTNKVFAGVCGGIGEYFDIDPTVIRVIWVILALAFGSGILAYIIAWIVMPKRIHRY